MAEEYCPLCDRKLLGAADVRQELPFDLTEAEWMATRELLLSAKTAWDERLAPDGYVVGWNCAPEVAHAHLRVLPRFDDEPLAGAGLRFALKHPDNRRPDPIAPGNGRARLLGASRVAPS